MSRLVECGHSFCYGCLRGWFHTCIERQVRYRDVPKHLKSAPYTAAKLRELFDDGHIYVAQFTCPLCRVIVRSRPIEIYQFKNLVHEANQLFGHPEDLIAANAHLEDHDIWADVFYKK
jgi:hypothetical protein